MAEFPKFPLWTDAYLADTTHLTTIQHGALLLLLITAWRSKTYALPDDDKQLAKYARLTIRQWFNIRPVIAPLWRIENGLWLNNRLLDELEAVRRMTQQRSDAGKASALKRQHRGSTTVQRMGNGEETPIPIPTQEVSKKEEIVIHTDEGSGTGKRGFGRDNTTIKDPQERINRFQKTIAEELIRQRESGWMIVAAAADKSNPGHEAALATCKLTAERLGKGWPHSWPA